MIDNLKTRWNNILLNGGVITLTTIAILSTVLNFLFQAMIVWVSGMVLIGALGGMPFLTYMQCIYVYGWFKVIYLLMKSKSK